MINLVNKTCLEDGCKKQPSYNIEGAINGIYCMTHKKDGMINIRSKKCIFPNCKTQPIYNFKNEKSAIYCSEHKQESMININDKKCSYQNCQVIPVYNYENNKKALFCFEHKKNGMINVKQQFCANPDCRIQPNYNYEDKIKALYCSIHKLPGMININIKTCFHKGCQIIPTYNYKGEKKPLFCVSHKKPEMINVKDKICIYSGCTIRSYFNFKGELSPLYCTTHKLSGMIDIKHKTCKTYLCQTRVKEKYDGYCLYCYINLFPEKPVSRNYKTKEYAVVEFIKTSFPELTWVSDKKITDGCSKRRPDLFLDLGYQIIIIEIDENQHLDYDCSCENKRIMELSQDVGHKPIVFIRFNPDEYYNDEIVINSCWGTDKKGISVVKKSKEKEWTQRLNALKEQVVYWLHPDNITTKTVETIQLFFDSGELRVPP